MRRTAPQPQVVTTFIPVSLVLQLTPGTMGRRHSLQYTKSPGMGTWALPHILSASPTYLLARSSLPSLTAVTDRSANMEERSVPSLRRSDLEICLGMRFGICFDTSARFIGYYNNAW